MNGEEFKSKIKELIDQFQKENKIIVHSISTNNLFKYSDGEVEEMFLVDINIDYKSIDESTY